MYYIKDLGNDKTVIVKFENNIEWGVPKDPANTDYKQYLEWVAEGNEAEEWVAE